MTRLKKIAAAGVVLAGLGGAAAVPAMTAAPVAGTHWYAPMVYVHA